MMLSDVGRMTTTTIGAGPAWQQKLRWLGESKAWAWAVIEGLGTPVQISRFWACFVGSLWAGELSVVSTCPGVTSQEVEFLSPSLAPTQVAMRQELGLGCPVFDSLMLKLALSCYLQSMRFWKEYCGLTSPGSLCLLYRLMLGAAASVLDEGLSMGLCGTSPLGVFCRRRVGLAGGLLPDRHSLDTFEGLAGAVLPGMISGDWAWCRVPKSTCEGREVTGEGSENPSRHLAMSHFVLMGGMVGASGVTVHADGVTVHAGGLTIRVGGVTLSALVGEMVGAGGVTVCADGVTVCAYGVTVLASGVTVLASGWNGSHWWRSCPRWWRDGSG
ncbi:hypothetical protein ACLB2K_047759 [Fragaria x ananassa]